MLKSFLTAGLNAIIFLFFLLVNVHAAEVIGPWASTESLPSTRASHGSFFNQNKVYIIGGANIDVVPLNSSSSVQAGGTLSSWASTSFPPSVFFHSMILRTNFVYSLGGATFPPTAHHNFVYLGTINASGEIPTWSSLNPLPKNLSLGAAVVVGDRIYYAGGFNNIETNQKIYMATINADGTISAWSEAGDLPLPLFGFGMLEHNNNLIVIGGFSGSSMQAKTYKTPINADGTIGTWQETSQLPQPVYRGGIIKIGSKALAIGGGESDLAKIYYADINADGTLGPWNTSANNLPQGVRAGAVTASDDYIYLSGGFNGTYLDTVYFAKIENGENGILNVPLLKQTADPWGDDIYDTANSWSPASPTIGAWGCAMTSAAMVLQFHGINKLPDNTSLDPGSLNIWLKNQPDGYVNGGSINWQAISRLSRLAKDSGNNPGFAQDALELSIKGQDTTQLTNDLNASRPIILQEPGHFIVAKGIQDTTFAINDPFYDRTDLTAYGNTFSRMVRYIPSNTDLSYIILAISQNVNITLKDATGNNIGDQFIQEPINNALTGNGTSGPPIKMLYFPKPPSGNYQILLSSGSNIQYNLQIFQYDQDANPALSTVNGSVGQNSSEIVTLNFDKTNTSNSNAKKTPTFQSVLDDIKELRALKLIKHDSVSKTLTSLINGAKKDVDKGDKKKATQKLDLALILIKSSRRSAITEETYQILFYDINYLKNNL